MTNRAAFLLLVNPLPKLKTALLGWQPWLDTLVYKARELVGRRLCPIRKYLEKSCERTDDGQQDVKNVEGTLTPAIDNCYHGYELMWCLVTMVSLMIRDGCERCQELLVT